jgi:tetratricopeptide (TPR) repeat protein
LKIIRATKILILIIVTLSAGSCSVNDNAVDNYFSGMNYAARGDFKKAGKKFAKALEIAPSYQLAERNIKIVDDVITKKLDSKSAVVFFRAVSRLNAGKLDESIPMLNKIIDLSPEFYQAYYYRGVAYSQRKNYDMGIMDFTKTIELNPKDAWAYNGRGLAFVRSMQEYDLAIADFQKALELEPEFAEAYHNRGTAYWKMADDRENACANWKQACKLKKCDAYREAYRKGYCK